MKEHIFTELLNRFEVETSDSLDIIGVKSKYNMYEISMYIDLDSDNPVLDIEAFGYEVFGKWTSLNYTDLQYKALNNKMDEIIKKIEEDVKEENSTEGAFTREDYNHFESLIFN